MSEKMGSRHVSRRRERRRMEREGGWRRRNREVNMLEHRFIFVRWKMEGKKGKKTQIRQGRKETRRERKIDGGEEK